MRRCPPLPPLPGFDFRSDIGRTRFHRKQLFDKIHDGVCYLNEKVTNHRYSSRYPSIYPLEESQPVPPWLAFDGQRLVFKAYFRESVDRKWEVAPYQIRVVNISFFLEDGTIKVTEPAIDNSGLEQGVLVRRQRIQIPRCREMRFYDIIDFDIGREVEFFGRIYKITDCDQFTREFMTRIGIPLSNQPEPLPRDAYQDTRKDEIFAKKPRAVIRNFGQFLKYDRMVLRFYGYWIDTAGPHRVVHDLEIHYYLADDTIEIIEKLSDRSSSKFLRRMKLPKSSVALDPIGSTDPSVLLNVIGDTSSQCYFMTDSLRSGDKSSEEYLKESDFRIGGTLRVFGRNVVITDLDDFTKRYYRDKYGIDDFTPLEKLDEGSPGSYETVEKLIPPYNGFGSYEDSLGNCLGLIPKAPRPNFMKFYFYDKQGLDSHVLRFRARLRSSCNRENSDRSFIIRVFLMDDTVSVFELAQRNSGFWRCLFQKRTKVLLPGQDLYGSKEPRYYEPQDFYIGAVLNLNGFKFEITSADVYALRYMESNCDKFPKSNVKLIMQQIRDALRPVYKEFIRDYTPPEANEDGILIFRYDRFKEALEKFMPEKLTEHEMITVARRYSSHEKKEFSSREYVRKLIHTELGRFLWDDLDRLKEMIDRYNHGTTQNGGYLARSELYSILRGFKLPIDPELLNSMLDHLRKNEEGKVDYQDLLEFMNVRIDPVPPQPPINVKTALWWASEKQPDCGAGIDWRAFIEDLKLEENENAGD